MSTLLSIDPGFAGRGNACAVFVDRVLVGVWFERVLTGTASRPAPCAAKPGQVGSGLDLIIIERPEYQGARTLGARPQDLMGLAWSGAMLAGAFAGRDGAPIVEMTPTEWKGTEPKPRQHARLWRALSDEEREVLGGEATERAIYAAREKGALNRWQRSGASYYQKKFDTHNLLDAAALGCTYLRRLEKR